MNEGENDMNERKLDILTQNQSYSGWESLNGSRVFKGLIQV